jgi:heme o synthase
MKPATDVADIPETLLLGGASSLVVPAADMPDAGAGSLNAATAPGRLADFYELTKPRMNFLVVVTTMVGYYMACRDWSDWRLLLHTLLGTALTAAGSAALNQYVERDYDALMPRTTNRPLATGRVAPAEGLAFGVLLSVLGLLELSLFVNPLTAALGALTLGSYVFLYTPLKRVTTLCTVVGAVPGALPPVMGVTAAAGAITPAAMLLFAVLFLWQMPHFLAIAILYRDDYAKGGFKMLPVVDEPGTTTARQIVVYSLALIPVTLMPALPNLGVAGPVYFGAAVLMGGAFLGFAVLCAMTRTRTHARQLFFASIIYLPALLAAMMLDKV